MTPIHVHDPCIWGHPPRFICCTMVLKPNEPKMRNLEFWHSLHHKRLFYKLRTEHLFRLSAAAQLGAPILAGWMDTQSHTFEHVRHLEYHVGEKCASDVKLFYTAQFEDCQASKGKLVRLLFWTSTALDVKYFCNKYMRPLHSLPYIYFLPMQATHHTSAGELSNPQNCILCVTEKKDKKYIFYFSWCKTIFQLSSAI